MSTPDCCRGVPGDENYKPKGLFLDKYNLNVYEVKASCGTNKGTLLFLPDAFGLASHNVILSDLYAIEGYDVLLVDILEGDPLPIAFMKYVPGTDIDRYDNFTAKDKNIVRKVDLGTWGGVHNPAHISSLVAPFVEKVKQEMPSGTKLYALGHCFGGKHALKLAQETGITAVIAMHPSFLEPSDSRDLNCPVFVGCAGK
ncbi:hypothetical protein L207DRAFT_593991 [Hyaloscypha variabilis F]|uniref:Dienelactone hydrolase domain-containing protein n=1 Tax=Hyaloscypha variabilis (strain UAMH 11265 / GT02V1 / F) TaxID=1149755 RepID=A0A2J6QRM7_HYAVF|nr:hypothetical protein L207DRAFT_593991 [Hyaloscypha variabilis F]